MLAVRTRFSVTIAGLVLLSTSRASAQTAHPRQGINVNGLLLTIPLAPDAGTAVYISVNLNGRAPRWWAVDTGASECIIDSTAAGNARVQTSGHRQIHGAGKGTVRLDSVRGSVHVIVRGVDLPACDHFGVVNLRNASGSARSLGGILGYEFFARYVVRIDFAEHTLKLYDPAKFRYAGSADTIPLEFVGKQPHVAVRIKTAHRKEVTRHLLVDTGSDDAVDDSSVRRNPRGPAVTVATTGLGASYDAVIGTLDTVRIGRSTFTKVPGVASEIGLVGNGIWSRFVCVFDYAHKRMFVEP
jgi:hypothetical protein